MHVIKYVAPKLMRVAGDERQTAASSRVQSHDDEQVVEQITRALPDNFRSDAAFNKEVLATVRGLVRGELHFIEEVEKPAATIEKFFDDIDTHVDTFSTFVVELISTIAHVAPVTANEVGVLEIEAPFITLVRNPAELIEQLLRKIVGKHFDGANLALGAGLAQLVVQRLCQVSGLTLEEARQKPHRIKWPKSSDMASSDLVNNYLHDTPLEALLLTPIKLAVSDRVRMEHTVLTAGAGHGKTQTLQHMIACDLDRPEGDEVGMVVIDSQGDLINNITRLKIFADTDRLLIVDASDIEYPIGLNIFDLGGAPLSELPPREREQVMNASVQLYEYVIGGLFGADMTQKQSTTFRFLIRLMMSIPGATIHTLRECLEEPKNFFAQIEQLPVTARQFFQREFSDRQFNDTRKQILRRLYGILQNPAFERMFASNQNKLNIYTALNEGRVVVCNTSREFLQDESRVFGRYCIAVTLKAAFDRARLVPDRRRTSFLYIDEASDYFDESVGQLLVQARKYRLGVVLAHQALEQMADGLRALVMSNTSIKLCGGASAKDARALSTELRTSQEFILTQEKNSRGTRFAAFVRNVTPAAMSWQIPFGTMEALPQMSDGQWQQVLDRNRREVCSQANNSCLVGDARDAVDAVASNKSDFGDFSESY
jgi:hypothetical protein